MTSNLGSGGSGNIGFGGSTGSEGEQEVAQGRVDPSVVTNFFRPEFFNRIDQTIYFQPLERKAIIEIAKKEISEINDREGLADAGRKLEVGKTLIEHIAEKGFDPVYGARPLQRSIEEYLITPLAKWLISNPKAKGTISAKWRKRKQKTEIEIIER